MPDADAHVLHDHPLPVEGCWRCDLKARLILMQHEDDIAEDSR